MTEQEIMADPFTLLVTVAVFCWFAYHAGRAKK